MDVHALHGDIEMLGDELGIGGRMALPGGLRADQHGDRAVLFEAHLGVLRRPARARLDVGRQADPADAPGLA
jgi:hypothetical protein